MYKIYASDSADSALELHLSVKKLNKLQRLAEVGRLSATLLHETSNLLTGTLLHLEQVDDTQVAGIHDARRSLLLLRRYVEAAQQQVRKDSPAKVFRLRPQIKQIQEVVIPLARRNCVKLLVDEIPDCQLYGDPVKFQQILANLLVNAVEAYAGNSQADLPKPIRLHFSLHKNSLLIKVSDWGRGITTRQLSYIFEPFYTTKRKSGRGLGIGLTIVKRYVVNDFQGSLSVKSTLRTGTVFTVSLPTISPAQPIPRHL